mmetsp:Transcript_31286/g.66394  ORF Transcript_31286/g.66394 Transcript_31286/m.66394 type:complete len:103 (-) Transcript_31286:419-727(-)
MGMIDAVAAATHLGDGEDVPSSAMDDSLEFGVDSSKDGCGALGVGEGGDVLDCHGRGFRMDFGGFRAATAIAALRESVVVEESGVGGSVAITVDAVVVVVAV